VTIELGMKKPIQDGISQQVIGADQTIIGETLCSKCKFLLANNPGNCMVTSLRSGEDTLGAICVVQLEKEDAKNIASFDAAGQRALNLLANSAAIAISNARLTKAERQKAKQAAAFAERELLAADLHDNLAQILSFTRIKMERLDEVLVENQNAEERVTLNQIETAISMAYQQVRDALVGLLKPDLVSDDFAKRLASTVDDFSAAHHIPVKLEIRDSSALSISHTIQTQVVQIVGEALSNVQRHSQSKSAWVGVDRVNGQARFTVGDSGIGFDPQKPKGDNHFGLRIMRTRAEKSGGEFFISSQPGEGTRISATFPISKHQKRGGQNDGEKL
jgi:two-component system nitrate/nitrite sensor histidine kinase NarX